MLKVGRCLNAVRKIIHTKERHKFVVVSDIPVSRYDAMEIQEPDYPIQGYDFYDFRCNLREDGLYESIWYCNGSAD